MSATPSAKTVAQESWPTTMATVISSPYEYAKLKDIDFETANDQSCFLVTFSYTVNGELFVDDFEAQTYYEEGHQLEVGYDPTHPRSNIFSTAAIHTKQGHPLGLAESYWQDPDLSDLQRKYGWDGE
jgi:hypothetical protein